MDEPTTLDYEGMRRSRTRVAMLLQELTAAPVAADAPLDELVVELNTAVEELLVAEEELRAQAEELAASRDAIDAERERYGDLFEFAPDAYLVTDGRGKILEANGPASKLLGVGARWLQGKLLVTYIDENERHHFRRMVDQLGSSLSPVDEHYLRMVPREGPPFVAAVQAASRQRRGEDSLSVRWMIRDITSRLDMEEEIRFLNSEVDLLASLNRVARLTAEPGSVAATIETLLQVAGRALPDSEVSVVLMGDRASPGVVAASGDRARALAELERQLGPGPSLTALAGGVPLQLTLADCAERWPEFADRAGELAVRAVTVHPLATPSGRQGCLTVVAFGDDDRLVSELAPLLADQVLTALVNANLYESASDLAMHLQYALESRGVIERAKGVLMGQQGCTDEQAFDILRRASQRTNRKLRDVAADLMAHVQPGERARVGSVKARQVDGEVVGNGRQAPETETAH